MIRPAEPFEFPISPEKSLSISVKTFILFILFFFFFFGDHLFLGRKTVRISNFPRKIRLNFGENLFFLEITCFWAEKPFEFPLSAKKYVSVSNKPFESDSRAMKSRVRIDYSCLTLSKKQPPFRNPGYAPVYMNISLVA